MSLPGWESALPRRPLELPHGPATQAGLGAHGWQHEYKLTCGMINRNHAATGTVSEEMEEMYLHESNWDHVQENDFLHNN